MVYNRGRRRVQDVHHPPHFRHVPSHQSAVFSDINQYDMTQSQFLMCIFAFAHASLDSLDVLSFILLHTATALNPRWQEVLLQSLRSLGAALNSELLKLQNQFDKWILWILSFESKHEFQILVSTASPSHANGSDACRGARWAAIFGLTAIVQWWRQNMFFKSANLIHCNTLAKWMTLDSNVPCVPSLQGILQQPQHQSPWWSARISRSYLQLLSMLWVVWVASFPADSTVPFLASTVPDLQQDTSHSNME